MIPTDTRASIRQLITRGGIFTAARLAQLAAAILVLPLLTRVLGPAEFGRAATALIVAQLLQVIGGAGFPAAAMRRYFDHDGPDAARRLVNVTTISAVAAVVLAQLSMSVWSDLFTDEVPDRALRVAVIAAAPLAVLNGAQALLRAMDRAAMFVATSLVGSVGAQCAGLAFASLQSGTAAQYLTGLLLGYVVAAFGGLVSARTGISLPHRDEYGPAIRFGIPTIAHSLAMYVLSAGDRLVIERLEGVEQVGRFHIAYLMGSLGILLLNAANNAWSPIVYGASDEERWLVLRHTSGIVHLLAGLMAAGLAIGGPVTIAVLVPSTYNPSDLAPVVSIITLATIPYASFVAYGQVLFQQRRSGLLILLAPFAATVNIALNILFVTAMGLVGAAAATAIAYLILGIGMRVTASRLVDLPHRHRAEIGGLAASIAGSAAAVLIGVGWVGTMIRIALTMILTVTMVVIAVRLSRTVPREARVAGRSP